MHKRTLLVVAVVVVAVILAAALWGDDLLSSIWPGFDPNLDHLMSPWKK